MLEAKSRMWDAVNMVVITIHDQWNITSRSRIDRTIIFHQQQPLIHPSIWRYSEFIVGDALG